ncbi:hypothetical protein A5700_00820 [Mycobacterium sp. E1214]|nr:hypothetical protein A5700_00820 [Mycobacterium sp. E1214]
MVGGRLWISTYCGAELPLVKPSAAFLNHAFPVWLCLCEFLAHEEFAEVFQRGSEASPAHREVEPFK